MVTIKPTRLHWIGDDGEDDPQDYCAHSPVEMYVDQQCVITPKDGDWTVSASAIILLRSLDRDHLADMEREEHVFPCCGHGIWPNEGGGVVISGCPNGIDFSIRNVAGLVKLGFAKGEFEVSREAWRSAVVDFAAVVRSYYKSGAPKDLSPESEPEGYLAMIEEWDDLTNRRNKAE